MASARGVTRQSELLHRTLREPPAGELSRNARLLERAGYVRRLMAGVYSFLPLGLRVLRNVERIIREEMTESLGAHEVQMPTLQPLANWRATGRDGMDVLFRTRSGNTDVVLGPSAEEVVTPLVGTQVTSYRDLPLAVFQIHDKFRDEPRPKSGLLRGREFGMKDMYSFHLTEADFERFYDRAAEAYRRIFARCGLGDVTWYTAASGGDFSEFSHEFQALTPSGEDTIHLDREKGVAINREIAHLYPAEEIAAMETARAIEVGNIFPLGTRYSDALGLRVTDVDGAARPALMGCYGIGTTRLVGAIAEVLSTEDAMTWPEEVAPYGCHVIPLAESLVDTAAGVAADLARSGRTALLDDRDVRAGVKLADADLIGLPHRLVIGPRTAADGLAEYTDRVRGESRTVRIDGVMAELASGG